jgi:acyl carrier protein
MSEKIEKIEKIVFSVISNNTDDIDLGVINKTTLLLSEGSFIDSMTLVSIIVDLETILSEVFQNEISLSDEKAMSRAISPYTDVNNLIEYIVELSENFYV